MDDARIVEGAIPEGYEFERFVAKAVPAVDLVIHTGLEEVDTHFLEGPLTEFLERLAGSSQTRATAERRGRQHVPLA